MASISTPDAHDRAVIARIQAVDIKRLHDLLAREIARGAPDFQIAQTKRQIRLAGG